MVHGRTGIFSSVARLALFIGASACSSSAVKSSIDASGTDSSGEETSTDARGDGANIDVVRHETSTDDTVSADMHPPDAGSDVPMCRPLFAACTTDSQCCAPNRCLTITGVPECQQEGPAIDGGNMAPDTGHADGAVACGTLQNTSPAITPTTTTSFPTTFAGGPLVDGIYELFAIEETVTTPGATYQRTFQLSSQGTAFEGIIHDEGVESPDHHFKGRISASGGDLAMVDTCLPTALYYPYDTQGSELTLYFLVGAGGRAFHYRAR